MSRFDDLGISSAAFAALAQHGRRSSGARAEDVSRCATMMTRGTAGPRLFAVLDAVGVREGRVQLPAIWGALTSWWVEPVADVAPSDDRRFFYLSQAPAGVDSFHDTVFAGEPPSAIAALNLICLEFSRDFVRRSSPRHLTGLGGAGITLWYQSAPIWDSLRATPEWIDLGISTPSYDWSADGRDPAWLIEQIEQAPVFAIASTEPTLALTMSYADEHADGPDDVVVVAPQGIDGRCGTQTRADNRSLQRRKAGVRRGSRR